MTANNAVPSLFFRSEGLRFRKLVLLGTYVALTLGGCMQLPAAQSDFSVLGNDPFSNLIREAYPRKVYVGAGGYVGMDEVDQQKATKFSRALLLGKTSLNVIELFDQEGGRCLPLSSDAKEKLLTCEVSRGWKAKSVDAHFDTSDWPEPAAKLIYKLALSDAEVVVGLELDIIDVTVNKRKSINY